MEIDNEKGKRLLRQACIECSEEAFCELQRYYQDGIVKMLLYYGIAQLKDLDDILQLFWLRVYEKATMFDFSLDVRNWLFQVAKRVALDFHDIEKTQMKWDRGRVEELRDRLSIDHRTGRELKTPLQEVITIEAQRAVREAISELLPKYQKAITDSWFGTLSRAEIARRSGMSASTLATHCDRGQKFLEPKLRKYHDAI